MSANLNKRAHTNRALNRCLLVTYSPIQKCNDLINQVVTFFKPTPFRVGAYMVQNTGGLVLVAVHVLHVNGVLLRHALRDRRLGEVLAAAQLLQDARALVFTFELLQGALDVFALFYRHDNHNILLFYCF